MSKSMESMYRRYRKNSPEALARVVATLLLGDGRIDPRELDFMDRVGVFSIIGVERDLFMGVAADLAGEQRAEGRPSLDRRHVRQARLDAALDAVDDRDQRHLVCAVLVYLAEADHSIDEEEKIMVRHVFGRWNVSADTLEREFKVPRHRTQSFLDAKRVAAA
jgi:hypothetical protein